MIPGERLTASFLVASCLVSAPAFARRDQPRRLPATEPGLSVETVTAIYEDRAGFLWIGSRAGLTLYDGYGSSLFEHDLSDPASLSDNAIRTVFEDSDGFLWIGTNAAGLDRLDRSTWTFDHHRHDDSDPASISNDSVYAVVEDRDGKLWVGTQGGLNRLDPTSGKFERFGGDYVAALRLGRDGALWIATVGAGLIRRDPETGRLTTYRNDPRDPRSIASDRVFSIAEDEGGRLWVATQRGACRMDPVTGSFERFPFPVADSPAKALATSVAADTDGSVWVSSWDAGLWRVGPGSGPLERRTFQPVPGGGATEKIVTTLLDRHGNLWVGTWGGGLGRVSPGSKRIGTLSASGDRGAPDPDVTTLLADGDKLWMGDAKNGVWLVERARATRVGTLPGTPLSMTLDARGDLWVGSTAGLYRRDPVRRTLVKVEGALDPGGALADWVTGLARDRNGGLAVGTASGGLYLRRTDGTFERFVNDPRDPNSLSDDHVTSVVADRRGTLWVGTRSGGLSTFDTAVRRWSRYLPDPDDARSLSHHNVTALLEAHDGTIWVGTGGAGVDRLERNDATGAVSFARFSESHGLIDDNVVSLAEDQDGTIWIGTRRGLSRFDPVVPAFANYGVEDGLPGVDMHVGAASSGASRIYFGTHRGAVVVQRGTAFPTPRPSPTVLVSMTTPTGPVESGSPPWGTSEIAIPHGRMLSLDFATLDYGDRRRHRYAYKLEPINGDWVDLGSRHDLTLTALDPGTFTLRIRARNDQGVWSETSQPLSIRVVPPFWMTIWFRVLVGLAVVGLAAGVHVVRTTRLARRNRELMQLKDQRERALEEARASEQSLGIAYRKLRELTGRLEAAKEEERKWIARELHDEMGTNLTTAKLVLQLQAGAPASDDREKRIGEAIGLLDRMIGHVRALSLDLRPPLLDELGLTAALRGYTEALARRAQLVIDLEAAGVPRRLPEDVGIAAFRIVQEALTNVIRHAAARRVSVEVRYDPGWLHLRVADDGKGFDTGAILNVASTGGHAGLLGMKERVESMEGEFEVRSASGRGTEIRARLPVRVEEDAGERAAGG